MTKAPTALGALAGVEARSVDSTSEPELRTRVGQARPLATATLLAFTAGFVDTASFVALFGLFAAHVTGNFVLIGASLAAPRPGILGKLLAFPMFLVTVAATRVYLRYCEHQRRDAARPLLFAQLIFLVGFLIAGLLVHPILDPDGGATILTGMLGVAAMAIQNAASRSVFSGHAPTTVMTGNVTQVTMDLVDLAFGDETLQVRNRLARMFPPLLGFTLGAIAGGAGFVWLGFWCLTLPIAAVVIILTST